MNNAEESADGTFEEHGCELPFLAAPPPTPVRLVITDTPRLSALTGAVGRRRR